MRLLRKDKVRILFVTNLFPPHYVGGYELGCREAVDFLSKRHEVAVLSSDFTRTGVTETPASYPIWRRMRWFTGRAGSKIRALFAERSAYAFNLGCFRNAVADFEPELVFFWNLSGVGLGLTDETAKQGIKQAHYVFDHFLADYPGDPLLRVARRLGAEMRHAARNLAFSSTFLRDRALPNLAAEVSSRVIPWGVESAVFAEPVSAGLPGKIRGLFVGQLVQHKGLHLLIEAIAALPEAARAALSVDVYGPEVDTAYAARCRDRAAELGVAALIRFRGFVPREALPGIYREHEVLFFPSLWEEPFGLALLEGMAAGLAVVAADGGAAPEIVSNGTNGILFRRGDVASCSAAIAELIQNPAKVAELGRAGRNRAARDFSLARQLEILEGFLRGIN